MFARLFFVREDGFDPIDNILRANRKVPLDVGTLARSYTKECIKQVAAVLVHDEDAGKRLAAASILLDRGYGRPAQTHDAKIQGELNITIRKLLGDIGDDE